MGSNPNKPSLWVWCQLGYTLLDLIGGDTWVVIKDKDHTHPLVTIGEIPDLPKRVGITHTYCRDIPQPQELYDSITSLGAQIGGTSIAQCSRSSMTLAREGHIHQSKLLSEDQEIPFQQSLGKYVDYLLISQNVMESYGSSLHHIPNIMVSNVNVMEHEILRKSDPALGIAIYHCCIQNLLKQLFKELPQPYYLTTSHASNNVLILSHAKRNKLFLPAHPRYHDRTKAKTTPWYALLVNNISDLINVYVSVKFHIFNNIS